MSEYMRGWTVMHAPAAEQGISLAGMGIPPESMEAWNHLQGRLQGELTPCAGKPQWTSNRAGDKAYAAAGCLVCPVRAACAEFADINGETSGIWGGIDRSKGKP